jgi:hypothetical protein
MTHDTVFIFPPTPWRQKPIKIDHGSHSNNNKSSALNGLRNIAKPCIFLHCLKLFRASQYSSEITLQSYGYASAPSPSTKKSPRPASLLTLAMMRR